MVLVQRKIGLRPKENHCLNFSTKLGKKLKIQFKSHQAESDSPCLWEGQLFCSIQSLIDWMRPIHIREGNLFNIY